MGIETLDIDTGIALGTAATSVGVWFLVGGIRAWLPKAAREFLDGPQRVWPFVYLVSIALVFVEVRSADPDVLIQALPVALAAIGVNNIKSTVRKT